MSLNHHTFDVKSSWAILNYLYSPPRVHPIIVAIEKHFEDFHEDQFDFHSYCIRKVTLRAYVDVLRWEDVLWGHETYAEAAEGIIRTYLHLHDNPAKSDIEAEPDYASMTPAERKKAKAIARKKRKKAEKKLEQDAAKAKEESNKSSKDEDPAGLDLLNKNPLEEAKTYANSLVKKCSTQYSDLAVSIRRLCTPW